MDSFICNDGTCIDKELQCNFANDCANGEDENNCESEKVCPDKQLRCHKNNICISAANWCDGNSDCPDGEDEEICHNVNNANFICSDGTSINKASRICDGNLDCKRKYAGFQMLVVFRGNARLRTTYDFCFGRRNWQYVSPYQKSSA